MGIYLNHLRISSRLFVLIGVLSALLIGIGGIGNRVLVMDLLLQPTTGTAIKPKSLPTAPLPRLLAQRAPAADANE